MKAKDVTKKVEVTLVNVLEKEAELLELKLEALRYKIKIAKARELLWGDDIPENQILVKLMELL